MAFYDCLVQYFHHQCFEMKGCIFFQLVQKINTSAERAQSAARLPAHFVPLQQELFVANWTKFVRIWVSPKYSSRSDWPIIFSRAYQLETDLRVWVISISLSRPCNYQVSRASNGFHFFFLLSSFFSKYPINLLFLWPLALQLFRFQFMQNVCARNLQYSLQGVTIISSTFWISYIASLKPRHWRKGRGQDFSPEVW